jgi:hypothetical protein
MTDNVHIFARSLAYHAAVHHVLGLALAKLETRGNITRSECATVLAHAERNMDVGEVRHTVELALGELSRTHSVGACGLPLTDE